MGSSIYRRSVRISRPPVARENALWAMPFDLERLIVTGEPTPVVEDVQVNSGGLVTYAVADDGSLAYRR